MVSDHVLPSLQATHGIKLAFLRAGANIESRLKMAQAGSGGGGEENKYHVTEAERCRQTVFPGKFQVRLDSRHSPTRLTVRELYLLSLFQKPSRPLALSQRTKTPVNIEISHANRPAAPCRCRIPSRHRTTTVHLRQTRAVFAMNAALTTSTRCSTRYLPIIVARKVQLTRLAARLATATVRAQSLLVIYGAQ